MLSIFEVSDKPFWFDLIKNKEKEEEASMVLSMGSFEEVNDTS